MSYALAFITTILLIWVLIPISVGYGFVDKPGKRKNHKGLIPPIGGIAMFGGLMFSMLTLSVPITQFKSFIAGCAILLLLGLMDDQYDLRPISRFFAQIVVAFLMISWGRLVIDNLGSVFLPNFDALLASWSIPFTVFYTVGAINASNMLDGMDGLAGGTLFIVHFALFFLAFWFDRQSDMALLLCIVFVIIGFLVFNIRIPGKRNALVFMGDGGSLFLGFSVVWFSISLSQGNSAVIRPVACLWIYAVPLFDTISLIFRRISKRQSPFTSDRTHLHHILNRAGFSVNQTVVFIWTITAMTCLVGIAGEIYKIQENISFGVFLVLLAIYCYGMTKAPSIIRFFRKRKRSSIKTKLLKN